MGRRGVRRPGDPVTRGLIRRPVIIVSTPRAGSTMLFDALIPAGAGSLERTDFCHQAPSWFSALPGVVGFQIWQRVV